MGTQVRQRLWVHVADKAVKDRAIGFEVEAFDVDESAVTRFHEHGNPVGARRSRTGASGRVSRIPRSPREAPRNSSIRRVIPR